MKNKIYFLTKFLGVLVIYFVIMTIVDLMFTSNIEVEINTLTIVALIVQIIVNSIALVYLILRLRLDGLKLIIATSIIVSIMVAGFAKGIGLSGYVCGALGAAIWYKMLDWGNRNQDKWQSMFNNPAANKVLSAFYLQNKSEMLCKNICNRNFVTIDEHSDYIKNSGCKNIIETLAKA